MTETKDHCIECGSVRVLPRLSEGFARPFTMVYLLRDDHVLMLKRSQDRKIQPGKWMGVGGHIEPGETAEASAVREFKEETGLDLVCPVLRGTLSWIDNTASHGTFYIFSATQYDGSLRSDCPEGHLEWVAADQALRLEDLAVHQELILPTILEGSLDTYTGLAVYSGGRLVDYTDTRRYFEQRRK
jgi:8-oxo-dGTP diphosphatase